MLDEPKCSTALSLFIPCAGGSLPLNFLDIFDINDAVLGVDYTVLALGVDRAVLLVVNVFLAVDFHRPVAVRRAGRGAVPHFHLDGVGPVA